MRYLLGWFEAKHELGLENLALGHQIGLLRRQVHKLNVQTFPRLVDLSAEPRWRHLANGLLGGPDGDLWTVLRVGGHHTYDVVKLPRMEYQKRMTEPMRLAPQLPGYRPS